MPSVKDLEASKNVTTESFPATLDGVGSEAFNSTKDNSNAQIVNNSVANNNGNAKEAPANPLNQIVLIIEHKIRNLEKRKNKLESYKVIEKSGKKLTSDQKTAVSKYDECIASLELTRELCKQFQSIVSVANKEAKKEAKRSAFVRAQQENVKVREVLAIQDVLTRVLKTDAREDFLKGLNGAFPISEDDFHLLDKLYNEISPKRPEISTEPTFTVVLKQAADHLCSTIDGRNKSFESSTYVHVRDLISSIQSCGYFEKDIVTVENDSVEVPEEKLITESNESESVDDATEIDVAVMNPQQESVTIKSEKQRQDGIAGNISNAPIFTEAPAATAVPTPSFPGPANIMHTVDAANVINSTIITQSVQLPSNANLDPENSVNVQQNTVIIPNATNFPVVQPALASLQSSAIAPQLSGTTVQAVEHAYFKQHYIQQQMKPIHEVIGTGNFFFLQESELDKPDVIPTNPNNENTSQVTASPEQQISTLPVSINLNLQAKPLSVTQPTSQLGQQFQTLNAPTNSFTQNMHSGEQRINMPQQTHIKNDTSQMPGFVTGGASVINAHVTHNVLPMHSLQQDQTSSQRLMHQESQSTESQLGAVLNSSFKTNIQPFPSSPCGLSETAIQSNVTKRISSLLIDPTNDKQKTEIKSHSTGQAAQKLQSQSEWNPNMEYTPTLKKTDEQWSNHSSMVKNSIEDDEKHYNLSRQLNTSNSIKSNEVVSQNSNRNENNFGVNASIQDQSAQASSHGLRGHRNTSNVQFQQNNASNARYLNDEAINNPAPTFFKNNERYYQQNQTTGFTTSKTDSSYQQRNAIFKNRSDSIGNTSTRSGYAVGTSNNGNHGGSVDYRSNARPVNSTRNTGPPSTRTQRTHSGNGSFGGPRTTPHARGQSSINA